MNSQHGEHREPRVHSITDASEAASIESHQRIRAYVIKMAFRVVFFIAGALLAHAGYLWWGLALLIVATVLPWMAVMGANLIKDSPAPPSDVTYVDGPLRDQLNAAPTEEKDNTTTQAPHDGGPAPAPEGASGTGSGSGSGRHPTPDPPAGSDAEVGHETISGEWFEDREGNRE